MSAAFDVGGRVLMHFLPRFAAVGAALDVRALLVDADMRSLVAGDDFAFGHGGGEIASATIINARE